LRVVDLEARGEVKRAARSEFTLYSDPPIHQIDQPLCDGEAEPAAAVAAGGRGIGLDEVREDRFEFVGVNTDAGVGNLRHLSI
jgi:hypothetical protein